MSVSSSQIYGLDDVYPGRNSSGRSSTETVFDPDAQPQESQTFSVVPNSDNTGNGEEDRAVSPVPTHPHNASKVLRKSASRLYAINGPEQCVPESPIEESPPEIGNTLTDSQKV